MASRQSEDEDVDEVDFVSELPDVFDPSPPSDDFVLASVVDALSPVSSEPPSTSESVDLFEALARRSFFAHPEPLNTIVGGAKALRIGPAPHSGHASGGGASTPWITSNRRPHAAQS
jgi:hypothetical protein